MVRLIVYLLTIALVAAGLSWLADRPGTLQVVWQGYDIETSVFRAVVLLAAAVASIVLLLVGLSRHLEQPGGDRPSHCQTPSEEGPRGAVERSDRCRCG